MRLDFIPHLVLGLSSTLASAATILVAEDGSGDFKTVQEAIDRAPENSSDRTTIHIKLGTYCGQLIVPASKSNLTLEGDDASTTSIVWDRNVRDPIPAGANKFNPGIQVKAADFEARNLTIENTSGDHGQALAMRIDADRAAITHCRLVGWQDTLMINDGRAYFADCYIAGRVDFIYGSATAWFETCEIHSRNGGYITAASTPKDHPFGFVFNDCKLTGDATPWRPPTTGALSTQPVRVTPHADLGRPWRSFGSVTFLNCEMGEHISPAGWNNWGKIENETTARYAEYNSRGPGANIEKRVKWAKQLSKTEAEKISVDLVLGGVDHWKPLR